MKVITYVRVSTPDQTKEDKHSLPAQRAKIDLICEREGVTERADFADEGVSAWKENSLDNLHGLAAALDYIEKHKPDAVIIGADQDRFIGREERLQSAVLDTLKRNNVKMITPFKAFDPRDPNDMMYLRFGSLFSTYESDIKSRRVAAAKEQRAQKGLSNAGGTVNYGYRRVGSRRDTRFEIVPEEAELVRFVLEAYAAGGLSRRGIVLEVRRRFPNIKARKPSRTDGYAFSLEAVSSIVRRARFYAGYVKHHDAWYPSAMHEAIIDDLDLIERVERIVGSHRAPPLASGNRVMNPYLFKGLIRCFACGAALNATTRKDSQQRNVAKYRSTSRLKAEDCPTCRARYINESEIESDLYVVMDALRELKQQEVEAAIMAARVDHDAPDQGKRRDELKRKRRRLGIAFVDGIYEDREAEYREEIERIDREIAALTPASPATVQTVIDDPMWELWGDRRATVYARGETMRENARSQTVRATVAKERQTLDTSDLALFFRRTLEAIFVDLGDKDQPIRFIAPSAALRPYGQENVYISRRMVGNEATGYAPEVGLSRDMSRMFM